MPQPSAALKALFKKEMTCEKNDNLGVCAGNNLGDDSEASEESQEDLRLDLAEGGVDFSKK